MMDTTHPRYDPACALCRLMQGPCIFHFLLGPYDHAPLPGEEPKDLSVVKPITETPQ